MVAICFRLVVNFLMASYSCKFELDTNFVIFKHNHAVTSNQEVKGEVQKGCLGNIEANTHPRRTRNE